MPRRACGGCWPCADRRGRASLPPGRSRPSSDWTSPHETNPPTPHRRNTPTRRGSPPPHVADRRSGAGRLQPLVNEEEISPAGETGDRLNVDVVEEPDGFRNCPPHRRYSLRWEARRRAARSIHHVAREQDGRHTRMVPVLQSAFAAGNIPHLGGWAASSEPSAPPWCAEQAAAGSEPQTLGTISISRGPSVSSIRLASVGSSDERNPTRAIAASPGARSLSPLFSPKQ